jgi:hypothetical protein
MPGGAGGEFGLLEQNDIAPALVRQVVCCAAAHDAAANDHHARMRHIHDRQPDPKFELDIAIEQMYGCQ